MVFLLPRCSCRSVAGEGCKWWWAVLGRLEVACSQPALRLDFHHEAVRKGACGDGQRLAITNRCNSY
jgi:hypothetical protein